MFNTVCDSIGAASPGFGNGHGLEHDPAQRAGGGSSSSAAARRLHRRSDRQYDTAKLNGIGQIQFSPGDSSAAATVAYYLPGTGALIPLDTANDAAVTILLGPGYASLASAAAVQTAMASAHATFVLSSPPSPTTSESRSLTPSLSVKPSC